MIEKVRETIEKYKMVQKGEKVLVGVSGGPDSLTLFHILWRLRDVLGISLHVVHVDHMLRGEESAEDARVVARFASQLGVPVTVRAVDVKSYQREKGLSTEMAARELRYKVYWEIMDAVGGKKVAVGHNRNDQAETVLMRFLRGSGGTGLAGMYPTREDGLIRPLLEVSRREIEAYCENEKLPVRCDPSNAEPVYTRNRVRLELLPLLEEKYNPNIIGGLAQMASIFQDEETVWEGLLEGALRSCVIKAEETNAEVDLAVFQNLQTALQRRLLRRVLGEILHGLAGISFFHVEETLHLVKYGSPGNVLNLPKGIQVQKNYRTFTISQGMKQTGNGFFSYPLPVPGSVFIPESQVCLYADIISEPTQVSMDDPYRAYMDLASVQLPLTVRNRRPGDRFQPLGMQGTQKLKEFFIDKKIPRQERDFFPLVVDQAGIVWVVGERLSERIKISKETKQLLQITAVKSCDEEENNCGK